MYGVSDTEGSFNRLQMQTSDSFYLFLKRGQMLFCQCLLSRETEIFISDLTDFVQLKWLFPLITWLKKYDQSSVNGSGQLCVFFFFFNFTVHFSTWRKDMNHECVWVFRYCFKEALFLTLKIYNIEIMQELIPVPTFGCVVPNIQPNFTQTFWWKKRMWHCNM